MSSPAAAGPNSSPSLPEGVTPTVPIPLNAPSSSKRKYEDALTLLDDAAGIRPPSTLSLERPPPPKRARTSVYSTLAKYGIGTSVDPKKSSLSNLQRVIMRAKAGMTSSIPPDDSDHKLSTYDPASRDGFLARLRTFKLLTYSSRPPEIDAVAAALCGWFNEGGKETLTCKTCRAVWTMPPLQGTSKEERAEAIARQKAMLIEQHQSSCPWRIRQSEASMYSMPLPSPSMLLNSILQQASRVQSVIGSLTIKHPLSNHQVGILVSAISSAQAEILRKAASGDNTSVNMNYLIDETAAIVTLFGWELASKVPGDKTANTSGMSTPVLSPLRTHGTGKAMVNCHLCNRQVGLWSFQLPVPLGVASPGAAPVSPQTTRPFDVLKEHRPHCPYVVKSTYLPTVNVPSKSNSSPSDRDLQPLPFVEGWKARMSVISRSQWRRASASGLLSAQGLMTSSTPSTPIMEDASPFYDPSTEAEVDKVKEIVKDVKSRHGGGRDLLKFVKGLLG
ncbi:hypothetical protein FRC18_007071 [Serendipita sp. 400]|nr:hypothetical protein FRC18_007071 [Serendipita sp. 400]